ncbi:hypothetical protein Nepgr_006210 [Nepenthes gracilis]|uniref:SKP1-like protein n=1 Tax=Nepenthes gracilis TaxID=150966 RepID=A0AAD3S4Y3_NEPGR|nr:hypothetical protein Nepgr_006210 [Nepenthes gracilis]
MSEKNVASESSAKNVVLRTSDEQEFVVEERIAVQWGTIKRIFEDTFTGKPIPLPNVDGKTLAKVIEYCKKRAETEPSSAEGEKREKELKRWDLEMFLDEPDDVIFNLALAANYLDIKDLLDAACEKIADTIKDFTVEDCRAFFGIESDFTPREEEEIRAEHRWAHDLSRN